MRRRARCVLALSFALGCSGGSAPPSPTTSSLPPGVAARAGTQLVSSSTVQRVAATQALTPRAALQLALSDALFAEGARARLFPGSARVVERAAAARSLLEQLTRDAALAGPPTAAELADIVHERWLDLDRPAAARTTHAVLLNDKPERDAAARAQADKLALALRSATTDAELMQLAKDFKPDDGFEVHTETLSFVTADGRVFQRVENGFKAGPGSFDVDFARAANALHHPGELSPVVKSSLGYHVIRLDELAPSTIVPADQLPTLLGPLVMTRRAGRARGELLKKLRATSPVQVERAVDDLTGRVVVAP